MSKKTSFFLICILFILSGVAALIYQIAWFKHLGYFLGNSTYSQAIVLATFMGGLAIGSWWWGKKADQTDNPLKIFAWLEILIGLYCYFYQPIFECIEGAFIAIVQGGGWPSDSSAVLLLKLFASASAIIIPTILMGGTLPVLVKYLSQKIDEVGKNVALLYFINSAGAVIGSFIAGFYLLGEYGITATTYFGASLDFIVGLIFIVPAYKNSTLKNPTISLDSTKQKEHTLNFSLTKQQHKIVLFTASFSGLSAMLYEVIWLRLLIPILSSTTYSFTIILTAFISGITIGSMLVYWLFKRVSNPYRLLGFCQLGIVVSLLLSLPFYEKLPYYIWKAIDINNATEQGYNLYLRTQFFYVFLLLLPPTVFMGMTLPIASKLSVKKFSKTGSVIGNVFALNTLGTVVGSLLAGLVFIPIIGITHSIFMGIAINLALAFAILYRKEVCNRFNQVIAGLVLLLSILIYQFTVDTDRWAETIMLSEIPRDINRNKAPRTFEKFLSEKIEKDREILYYNEGIGGTVVVGRRASATFLYTNGKGDANSVSDIQTQASLGHTPMILHRKPDSVFVIGFGAGHTIGSVMTHPEVDFAQVAEISPEVIEASKYFEHVNEQPLNNPKLNVIKDDGLAALRLSPYKYDVIISQPSNPWSAGVGNLFTKEFFADCKSKLKPGGFVAQWFGLYEMDERSLKMIFRTALSEFEHLSLWHLGSNDILLLCSEDPFEFDIATIEKHYLAVKKNLSADNIEIFSLPLFLSQHIPISSKAIESYVGDGPLNTEDFPLMELWTPRAYFFNESPKEFESIMNWSYPLETNSALHQLLTYTGRSEFDNDTKAEISLFKATQFKAKNYTFLNTFSKLSGNRNSNIEVPNEIDPQALMHGWLDAQNHFHAIDTINPNQKTHAWTCCGQYEKKQQLTYRWISPKNDTLIKQIEQQSDWLATWVELDHTGPLEIGNWKSEIFKDGKLILTQEFVVSDRSKAKIPDFMHGTLIIGFHKGQNIASFTEVNPMQKLAAITKGLPYGKKEMVNIQWTSPSGKVINQMQMYEPHYEIAWRYIDAPRPLETGVWKVEIQRMDGKSYLSTSFTVNPAAKLLLP